jgi:hypothetical protein
MVLLVRGPKQGVFPSAAPIPGGSLVMTGILGAYDTALSHHDKLKLRAL